ncbi:MAG: META domain-containing protein [Gemmatimonadaceae bacterium]
MSRTLSQILALLWCIQPGCTPRAPAEDNNTKTSAPPTITDRDWELIALGDRANPLGAGQKPVTMRLSGDSVRASGFSGCNRYAGPYSLSGDTLTFGPLMSTKMFCADGDEVERGYLAALGTVSTYQISDSILTLSSASAPLARFRAR